MSFWEKKEERPISQLNDIYFNPVTGEFRPAPSRPYPTCFDTHSYNYSYWKPCLKCGRRCNCDWKEEYPSVRLITCDDVDMLLSPNVVRGSNVLQDIIRNRRRDIELGLPWARECPEDVLDLRKMKKSGEWERTTGVAAAEFRLIEKYMEKHLEQVQENIVREKRCELARKLYPNIKSKINFVGWHDWEEEMFGNMPQKQFIELMQVKHLLEMVDLHVSLEKWIHVWHGIPNVENFGSGLWMHNMGEKEIEEGCLDYPAEKPIKVVWGESFHSKIPSRYDAKSKHLWRKRIWRKY